MDKIKSLLFVPAVEKFLNKINILQADALIFDIEESILPEDKEKALNLLITTLAKTPLKKDRKFFVRVNKDRALTEIKRLEKTNLDGYMLPKFEDINFLENILNHIEDRKIIGLIETPMGVLNLEKIAAHPRISALAFGAEDYSVSINMENTPENLLYAKSKLITCAKAFRKPVFDTPCLNVKDALAVTNDITRSMEMGFSGKLAIHPQHSIMINEIFNNYDYDYIQYIIEEYEKNNSAILVIDGKVYEKMHYLRFKKILNNRNE